MISISAPIYDPSGVVRIQDAPASDIDTVRRRVNRQRTLDGGVVVNDGGFAHGDRDLRVTWRPKSSAEYASVQRLVRLYPQLIVSTREGVFRCAPSSLESRSGEATLSLMVIERFDA